MSSRHNQLQGSDLHYSKTRQGSGSPVGVVTPSIAGEQYQDTTSNLLWYATGTTSSSWVLSAGAGSASAGAVVNNNATNASFVSGLSATLAGNAVTTGQAAACTLGTNSAMLVIDVSGAVVGTLVIVVSYTSAGITCLSDPENLFVASGAASGIYVHKSANSAGFTIKNQTGSTATILCLAAVGVISSANAWA